MKKSINRLTAALLSVCFLTGCTGSPSELSASSAESAAETGTSPFVEDYQYVWTMLEENFPLMGVLERTCGDLEEFQSSWQRRIARCETQQEFHDTMSEFSVHLRSVGHLLFLKIGFPISGIPIMAFHRKNFLRFLSC